MNTATQRKPNESDRLRAIIDASVIELEEALALRVGVMDSENKALAVANQRVEIIQRVISNLREA